MGLQRGSVSALIEGAVVRKGGLHIDRQLTAKRGVQRIEGRPSVGHKQDQSRHIDHYIDGIDAPRRERRPFDPVAYMRGGKAA